MEAKYWGDVSPRDLQPWISPALIELQPPKQRHIFNIALKIKYSQTSIKYYY